MEKIKFLCIIMPPVNVFDMQQTIIMDWLISFLLKLTDFKLRAPSRLRRAGRGVFPSGEQQVFRGRSR